MSILDRIPQEVKDLRDKQRMLKAEFDSLREQDGARIQRFRDTEAEYETVRSHPADASVSDYGRVIGKNEQLQRHQIPFPYEHPMVQKHAYRIAGRPPDIVCPRLDNSNLQRFLSATKEKMLYACYDHSMAEEQLAGAAHDGSLHGTSVFRVYWKIDANLPCFRAECSGNIVVVPTVENPLVLETAYYFHSVSLHSFRRKYEGVTFPTGGTALDVDSDGSAGLAVTLIDCYDDQWWYRLAGDHIVEMRQHGYGFCPYIIIPNLGPPRRLWGYSDYEFVRHLIRYYEALQSRIADATRAAANGAYLSENTGNSPGVVKRIIQTGGVLDSRKDGSVAPIPGPDLGAHTDAHLAAVREAINDIGFTPPAAWGTLGAASGSDRALQMAPQQELTALKQIHWSAGLRRMNEMLLKLIESKTVDQQVVYRGKHTRGHRVTPFAITLNATENSEDLIEDGQLPTNPDGTVFLPPKTPAEVIRGDYQTDVIWEQRLNRDDPEFILAELNKFAQAAQSLQTTLERLGIESPEDEMKLIEKESERFPWLRNGMIALINAQMQADAKSGGGEAGGGAGGLGSALQTLMGGGGAGGGAFNQDALNRGLNGSDNGGGQRGGPGGSRYGGA